MHDTMSDAVKIVGTDDIGRSLPKRKNIRLKEYDYSQAGYYYVTICVKDKRELFGKVGTTALGRPHVKLSEIGQCADETIRIANKNKYVRINKYVIMPNHIHMIVVLLNEADDRGRSSLQNETNDLERSSLQQVVRNIKSYITKRVGSSVWQPRFYDHIIRNESDYQRIWQYIDENPSKWLEDEYFVP